MPEQITKPKIKNFPCDYCGAILCRRRGNQIIGAGFILELKKTHRIFCEKCRRYTLFKVNRSTSRENYLDLEQELN